MKILIMGASCAGSTTLGSALAAQLGFSYFDTDNYFWEPSEIPFTVRRSPDERNEMLIRDLIEQNNWIIGGSVNNWGPLWQTMFDLVIFLYVPPRIRLQRLKAREIERYGNAIFIEPERIRSYNDFLTWAAGYDDNTNQGRTLQSHREWLDKLLCPVLEITGDTTVEERIEQILHKMSKENL